MQAGAQAKAEIHTRLTLVYSFEMVTHVITPNVRVTKFALAGFVYEFFRPQSWLDLVRTIMIVVAFVTKFLSLTLITHKFWFDPHQPE